MTKISSKKLLHSKWTAKQPHKKQKHFLVVEVEFNDDQTVAACIIEAVYSKQQTSIEWTDLKNPELWCQGWR